MKTRYLYHGTAPEDICEIVRYGLDATKGHAGVSFTTSARRAAAWASLKQPREYVLREGAYALHILRVPAHLLGKLVPDTLKPANPKLDFIAGKHVPPEILEVEQDGTWNSLIETYAEACLDEDENSGEDECYECTKLDPCEGCSVDVKARRRGFR